MSLSAVLGRPFTYRTVVYANALGWETPMESARVELRDGATLVASAVGARVEASNAFDVSVISSRAGNLELYVFLTTEDGRTKTYSVPVTVAAGDSVPLPSRLLPWANLDLYTAIYGPADPPTGEEMLRANQQVSAAANEDVETAWALKGWELDALATGTLNRARVLHAEAKAEAARQDVPADDPLAAAQARVGPGDRLRMEQPNLKFEYQRAADDDDVSDRLATGLPAAAAVLDTESLAHVHRLRKFNARVVQRGVARRGNDRITLGPAPTRSLWTKGVPSRWH